MRFMLALMTTFVLASIGGTFSFDGHTSASAQELNFTQVNSRQESIHVD